MTPWIKYSLLLVLFFGGAIIQMSLLPFFSLWGIGPNLLFIIFFIVSFFSKNNEAFFSALIGGFFLDVLNNTPFGITIVSLLIISLLQKLIMHILKGAREDNIIFFYIALFCVSFLLFYGILFIASLIFHEAHSSLPEVLVGLPYSLLVAIAGFFICQRLWAPENNQLKLF